MTILRNILAVVIGVAVGGGVNMALIILGPYLIPPPVGVDVTNAASIGASMHLFELKHFVFPFLAHALGTLVGALVAYLTAASYRSLFSYVIGAVFFVGGIAATAMIPAPLWFTIIDLAAAYIPMSWLGKELGMRIKGVH